MAVIDARTLVTIVQLSGFSPIAEDPTAPRLLVFGDVCEFEGEESFTLHLLDLVGGGTTRIAADEWGFWSALWSPDGQYIVVAGTRGEFTLIDATMLEIFERTGDGRLIISDIGGRGRCE
jgi:hypothetical protein